MHSKVRKRTGRLKRRKGGVKGAGAEEGLPGLITQSPGARKEFRLCLSCHEKPLEGVTQGERHPIELQEKSLWPLVKGL